MDIEQTLWGLIFIGAGAALGFVTLGFIAAGLELVAGWLEERVP